MAQDLQATINMIDYDLPYLHKQRWARIAADLSDKVHNAHGPAKAEAERELAEHYDKQFDSASSRDAIIEDFRRAKKLQAEKSA